MYSLTKMGPSSLNITFCGWVFYVFCYYQSQVPNHTIKSWHQVGKTCFLGFSMSHTWLQKIKYDNECDTQKCQNINFANLMTTFNGTPENLGSIDRKKTIKHPPTKKEYWGCWCPFSENLQFSQFLRIEKIGNLHSNLLDIQRPS